MKVKKYSYLWVVQGFYQGDDKKAAVWAEIYKQVFTLQMRIVEV